MDVVVTVPKARWQEWLAEGDLPGEPWSGSHYVYTLGGFFLPTIEPGERVYVVAHGKLRGYAPLVMIAPHGGHMRIKSPALAAVEAEEKVLAELVGEEFRPLRRWGLMRGPGAVTVTITEPIKGFRGWRYRWWPREAEVPYPGWRTP